MRRFLKIVGALLSISMFHTETASAFTLLYSQGANLTTIGWKRNSLAFDIDTSCASFLDDVNGAIAKAQGVWNHVPSSALNLSVGATVTLPQAITVYVGTNASSDAPVGNPIIYCDTSFQSDSGLDPDSIPGFASSQNLLANGQLQGGLLVLNFQSGALANVHTLGPDLSSIILAHEMGHILGLGHSSDPNALMYYATSTTRKLELAQDDVDGISYLYPRSEPGQGGPFGCGTLAVVEGNAKSRRGPPGPGGVPSGALELSLLLVFAALICGQRFRFTRVGSSNRL